MSQNIKGSLLLAMSLTLAGCATIVEGTSQSIMVDLSPQEATCVAFRDGTQIASVGGTNRTMNVQKSRHDIILRCSAPGHQTADSKVESSASGWGVVGAVTLDFGVVDYATGALNKYPNSVTVALVRQ
jgi:hypothetical protein